MQFIDIPTEKYEDYRELFFEDHCPQSFVNSAFIHKDIPLLVDKLENPNLAYLDFKYAKIIVGDPSSLNEQQMLSLVPEHVTLVVDKETWLPKLLEFFEGKLVERRRTRMSHAKLSTEHLDSLKKPLPDGYSLVRVDKGTAENLPEILQVHIPVFFGSVDRFMETSVAFCVKHGDKAICMASSSIPMSDLFEMQVATVDEPEYRRKGFATAVCIAMIQYCLENNIEPIWEAANDRSVDLALKLGYTDPVDVYQYYWRNE